MRLQTSEVSEIHAAFGAHSGERQLWCAVLGRALNDALDDHAAASTPAESQRLRAEARAWFHNNGPDFRGACDSAGYNPDDLRRRVLTMIARSDSATSTAA